MAAALRWGFLMTSLAYAGYSWSQDSIAERYAREITAERLKTHLYILAHDSLEGRETGMPGQKKAATYIADYFSSLGVPPSLNGSYFQEFPLKTTKLNGVKLAVNGRSYTYLDDFFFFPGFDLRELKGDAVFIGYGIDDPTYSDYTAVDVKDRVVFMLDGEPFDAKGVSLVSGSTTASEWTDDWRRKRDVAREKGAKAVLMVNNDYRRYIGRMRYWLDNPALSLDRQREEGEEVIPMGYMAPDAFDRLLADGKLRSAADAEQRISKGKKMRKQRFVNVALAMDVALDRLSSENVLCYISGNDPEVRHELLVITAHYDHIGMSEKGVFNGADDDGSGTVAVLEMARAFKLAADEGNGPRRSVLLMTVSGEEKGLLGSEWYVSSPVFPLEHTVANLNVDMIGRMDDRHEDPNYIYLIGSDRLSTDLHRISEEANERHTGLKLDYTYNAVDDPNRFYYRSDHYNFAKNGIPVIFYFSGVHEDYHGVGDTADKIMYDKMETVTRLIFHTAWDLLNADHRPVVDVEP